MEYADFRPNIEALTSAVGRLAPADSVGSAATTHDSLGDTLPDEGVGPQAALDLLAPLVLDGARDLGAPGCFAHMDPPTPWVTWAASMWTASRNQNLLHPDTSPEAAAIEQRVIGWLAPVFGMNGGHLTPGSTIANLTALWAARELGATEVVATRRSHLSVVKAAQLLAMPVRMLDRWDDAGDVSRSAVVITAGDTSTGAIERLDAAPGARWRHVDAAWAGPLRLSERHRHLLDGVDEADSVAVSAHKWLFQPKESAMVLFADADTAHAAVTVNGPYLARPNVGVLGSHGATAVPLLATLLAYGRSGLAATIDRTMELADELHELIVGHAELVARATPATGVVNWRHRRVSPPEIRAALPDDVLVSTTTVDGEAWLRSVAANPMADPELVVAAVVSAAARAAG